MRGTAFPGAVCLLREQRLGLPWLCCVLCCLSCSLHVITAVLSTQDSRSPFYSFPLHQGLTHNSLKVLYFLLKPCLFPLSIEYRILLCPPTALQLNPLLLSSDVLTFSVFVLTAVTFCEHVIVLFFLVLVPGPQHGSGCHGPLGSSGPTPVLKQGHIEVGFEDP